MKGKDIVLKMLLDNGITDKIANAEICFEIAELFGPILESERDLKKSVIDYFTIQNEIKESIQRILDGKIVSAWEGEDDE